MPARTLGGASSAALVTVAGAGVGALVLVPLARLAQTAADGASLRRVLRAPGFGTAAAHSFELAAIVPLLAVPIGAATALVLRRPDVPCRGLLRVLAVLPLLVPQFVLGYSWTQAYGRAGFTDELVGLHWEGLTGPAGLVVVLVVDAAPLSYLLTAAGLATRAQPQLERAARTAGAGEWTVLRTIVLPLLRPVFAASFVLTFVATLDSFAAPQVLGTPAGYATMTTQIYTDLTLGGDPASFTDAITLSLALALVSLVLLLPADLALGPRLVSRRTAQPGHASSPTRRRRGAGLLLAALLAGYALLAVLLPTLALVSASITRAIGLPPSPGNWTLANFRTALDGPTREALLRSVQLAVLAAIVLTVLGAAVAALERFRGGRLLGTFAVLTFAMPGSALAVGLLIAYQRWLGGTLALILLAYLAKFWALAHRTTSAAVDRLPPGEWHAARVSGASALVAARTVWLPALRPALLGGAVLVFIASLHEVTMSSLLYSTGTETFAVAVLNSQQLGTTTSTAALSVTLTALLLGAGLVWLVGARVVARRGGPGGH